MKKASKKPVKNQTEATIDVSSPISLMLLQAFGQRKCPINLADQIIGGRLIIIWKVSSMYEIRVIRVENAFLHEKRRRYNSLVNIKQVTVKNAPFHKIDFKVHLPKWSYVG